MSNLGKESAYITANTASDAPSKEGLASELFKILARNAVAITVASLASAAVLVASYLFLVRPLFFSETYIAADGDTLVRLNVFLQSPFVLDALAEKAGLSPTSSDTARAIMHNRILFRPAPGENRGNQPTAEKRGEADDSRPDPRFYLLVVRDPNAQIARDLSFLIIEKWKQSLLPFDKGKIEAELTRQTKTKTDVDSIIAHFDKEVTTYVTPQTNSGEVATPLVKLIMQRADLAKRIENLQNEIKGTEKLAVVSGPTSPDRARRPIGFATLILGSITGSLMIILGFLTVHLIWREIQPIRSQAYSPGKARRE